MPSVSRIVAISLSCYAAGFFFALPILAPFLGASILKSVAGVAADIRGS